MLTKLWETISDNSWNNHDKHAEQKNPGNVSTAIQKLYYLRGGVFINRNLTVDKTCVKLVIRRIQAIITSAFLTYGRYITYSIAIMSSRSMYLVRFMPKKVAIRAALVNVEAQPHIEEAIHVNLKFLYHIQTSTWLPYLIKKKEKTKKLNGETDSFYRFHVIQNMKDWTWGLC